MALRFFVFTFVSLLLGSLSAHAESAKDLVGKYQMEADESSGMELRANGTAVISGEETKWSVRGNHLTLGPDTVSFQLQPTRLVFTMAPGVTLAWKRLSVPVPASPLQKAVLRAQQAQGGASSQAEAAPRTAMEGPPVRGQGNPPPAGNAKTAGLPTTAPIPVPAAAAQDEQARQLLISSAWCSFTYKQTGGNGSGATTTARVIFRPDGTMVSGTGAETASVGNAGTVAGHAASQTNMHWKVENLRLLVDAGQGFQDIGLEAYKNSAGYPILRAQGREYSMCR